MPFQSRLADLETDACVCVCHVAGNYFMFSLSSTKYHFWQMATHVARMCRVKMCYWGLRTELPSRQLFSDTLRIIVFPRDNDEN